jgi:hypothetical protein
MRISAVAGSPAVRRERFAHAGATDEPRVFTYL